MQEDLEQVLQRPIETTGAIGIWPMSNSFPFHCERE